MSHDFADPWQNIRVAKRCGIEWRNLSGEERVRKCSRCLQNIFDIDGLGPEDVELLVRKAEGSLPRRFFRRQDGTIMTLDCPRSDDKGTDFRWSDALHPSQSMLYLQFARVNGGEFIERAPFAADLLRVRHRHWTISLEQPTMKAGYSPKISSPFLNPSRFQLRVFRRTGGSDWNIGMESISTGHSTFDKQFVIQGSDKALVSRFFGMDRLRDGLLAQREPVLAIKEPPMFKAVPKFVNILSYSGPSEFFDLEQVTASFDLVADALDQLCDIGVIPDQDPGFVI